MLSNHEINRIYQQSLIELGYLRQRLLAFEFPKELCERVFWNTSEFDHNTKTWQDIEPLRFSTHQHAMDAADYAFCQLLCDEDLPWERNQDSGEAASALTTPWVQVLLRIVVGLNIADCTHRNMFRRGICTMLYFVALRTNSPLVLSVLIEFMERLGHGWEDTYFPISVAWRVVTALSHMVGLGHEVLLVAAVSETVPTSLILSPRELDRIYIFGQENNVEFFKQIAI